MDQEFVQIVVKFLKLDSRIKETVNSLKELKSERKQYEEAILNLMSKNNQEILNISSGGSLRKSVSKTKGALKQDYITQVLTEFTKNKNEAMVITEQLMNNRPLNERTYLKRTNPRKDKSDT
jgi:hypothetical protein